MCDALHSLSLSLRSVAKSGGFRTPAECQTTTKPDATLGQHLINLVRQAKIAVGSGRGWRGGLIGGDTLLEGKFRGSKRGGGGEF